MAEMHAPIAGVRAAAYRIPTDAPEADGTLAWDATTLVVVHVAAADTEGLGYTYADSAAATLAAGLLAAAIAGRDAFDVCGCQAAMQRAVRNLGRSGLAACAISGVDCALWDLKARLLGLPLSRLLGQCRDEVAVYGSGGFTCYTDDRLHGQLGGWVQRDGCHAAKMKIGAEPERDPHRIRLARSAVGDRQLFVDANGALSVKQAEQLARRVADSHVTWFEEPVSSDDPAGLRQLRTALGGIDVAAGEYIYTTDDARHLLEAGAVDVLQADATRCGGISGFLAVAHLADAHHIDLSSHCAPAIHRHLACHVSRLRHMEWFHDHVRIEQMLFDGAPQVRHGRIRPDRAEPGHGLVFKQADAERFRAAGGGGGS